MGTDARSAVQPPVQRERSGWGWQKTQGLGGVGVPVTLGLVMVIFQEFDPFFLIMGTPLVIALLLRLKFRRVGTVLVGVLALALMAMNAPFLIPSLQNPEAGWDFVLPVMLVLSALTAIVATVPAYREISRGTGGSAVPKAVTAVAVVLVLAAGATGLLATTGFESAVAQPGDVTVEQVDFAFEPENVTTDAGEIAIFIENKDASFHTFTIDELGVDVSVPAGKSARVTFRAAAGEYRFYCKPHVPDMEGKLVIG